MEMARVILFTGQMEKMSKFYGEVLGLERVTDEKGWREFAAGGATVALHPGPSCPGGKGRRSCSVRRMWPRHGKSWWRGEQNSGRSVTATYFAFATARIRTEIRFSCLTADTRVKQRNRRDARENNRSNSRGGRERAGASGRQRNPMRGRPWQRTGGKFR
jgi:catechol 2,3-dioxygenase-like lactoylglutathione lyase family enzyme